MKKIVACLVLLAVSTALSVPALADEKKGESAAEPAKTKAEEKSSKKDKAQKKEDKKKKKEDSDEKNKE